jgi:hypothetical protein
VQPLPGSLVLRQIIFASALTLVLGVIVAWLYRDRTVTG